MPKRRHDESKVERWARKMKKYEEKVTREREKKSRRIIYSSEDEDAQIEDHLETGNFPKNSEVGITLPDPSTEHEFSEHFVPYSDIEPELSVITDIDPDIDPDIDTDMLKVLGDIETDDTEWGDDVQSDIAKRINLIITNGLKKEVKEDLSKKYLFPKNISLLKAPKLNPEIITMLNESSQNRDKRLIQKQEQLGLGLTTLSRAMSILLKRNPDIPEALRILNDSLKLISDSHYLETDTRKCLILGLIDKSLVNTFKDRKRDEYLFGDKLGDLVKNSRGIKKTSELIQASSSTKNWKTPPPARFCSQKSNHPQASRAGGYQAQYASRRRALPPPAPPAARRQPAAHVPRRQQPSKYAPPPPYPGRRQPQPPPRPM